MSIHTELPAGMYWIGDPCYVFPHEGPLCNKWVELLETNNYLKDSFAELDDGKITVWADITAFGDGSYLSSVNKRFGVDSGMLGIVPIETVDYLGKSREELEQSGLFVSFDTQFEIKFSYGFFLFGDITIETNDDDYDEEYDDSDDDEEYDEEYDDNEEEKY